MSHASVGQHGAGRLDSPAKRPFEPIARLNNDHDPGGANDSERRSVAEPSLAVTTRPAVRPARPRSAGAAGPHGDGSTRAGCRHGPETRLGPAGRALFRGRARARPRSATPAPTTSSSLARNVAGLSIAGPRPRSGARSPSAVSFRAGDPDQPGVREQVGVYLTSRRSRSPCSRPTSCCTTSLASRAARPAGHAVRCGLRVRHAALHHERAQARRLRGQCRGNRRRLDHR